MTDNGGLITPDRRKELPPRGKGKRVLILDSIIEKALLGLDEGATREDAERAMFGFMAQSAFCPTEDTASVSTACLNLLMKKGWPDMKATMPTVEFEFDKDAKPYIQAAQIMSAAASGEIPPDVASTFIASIASMMKINEITELEERIAQLEAAKDGD